MTIDDHFVSAWRFFYSGNYKEAIKEADISLKENPQQFTPFVLKAQIRLYEGEINGDEFLEEMLALRSRLPDVKDESFDRMVLGLKRWRNK